MNRKVLILLGILALGFLVYWYYNQKMQKQGVDEIKIGAILPLTGDAAIYGTNLQKGMNLALEQYSLANEGKKIQILYEDSKADPKIALTSFEKLHSLDKCKIVVGGFSSSEALTISPIAEKNKILFVSPTASSPLITDAGDYIFRTTPSDNFDGEIMANFANKYLGLKTISLLYINNEYGQGISKVFKQKFETLGGKIVVEKSFDPNSSNFKSQLLDIKTGNSQGIYVIAVSELGNVLKQKKELSLTQKVITVGLAENPNVVQIAGKNVDSVYYSYPAFQVNSKDSLVSTFVTQFKNKYSSEPDVLAAYGYDLANILIKAIKNSNYELVRVKDEMYKIQDFNGVTGETSFDKNGDIQKTAGIKIITNGKFEWLINNFK